MMPPYVNIVDLPVQLVEQVFKYLRYEEVSKLREVLLCMLCNVSRHVDFLTLYAVAFSTKDLRVLREWLYPIIQNFVRCCHDVNLSVEITCLTGWRYLSYEFA